MATGTHMVFFDRDAHRLDIGKMLAIAMTLYQARCRDGYEAID